MDVLQPILLLDLELRLQVFKLDWTWPKMGLSPSYSLHQMVAEDDLEGSEFRWKESLGMC